MVSQADRDLIQNFATELEPFIETVMDGVRQFEYPARDSVIVGQAVQSLGMIRGAGSILMVDPLVEITDMLSEGFDVLQGAKRQDNPVSYAELCNLAATLRHCLEALLHNQPTGETVGAARRHLAALMRSVVETGELGAPEARTVEALLNSYDEVARGSQQPPESGPQRADPLAETIEDAQQSLRQTEQEPLDPELREIFLEEAAELIVSFRDNAIALTRAPADRSYLLALRRDAHTLKGAANMTGFKIIGQIGAAVENVLDDYVERKIPVDREARELVLVCWKMLPVMLNRLDDLSMFAGPAASVARRAADLRDRFEAPALDGKSGKDSVISEDVARPQPAVPQVETTLLEHLSVPDFGVDIEVSNGHAPQAPEPASQAPAPNGHPGLSSAPKPPVTQPSIHDVPRYADQFGRAKPELEEKPWRQLTPEPEPTPVENEPEVAIETSGPELDQIVAEVEAPAIEEPAAEIVTENVTPVEVVPAQVVDTPSRERLGSALLDLAFEAGSLSSDPATEQPVSDTATVFDESRESELALEMFELFEVECADLVDSLNRSAMQLDRDSRAALPLRELMRALHTLKGAASAADMEPVADECHRLEEVLQESMRRVGVPDAAAVNAIFETIGSIEAIVEARRDSLAGTTEIDQPEAAESEARLRVPMTRLDGLLNLVGELVVNRAGFEQRLERLSSSLDELSLTAQRLQRSGASLERRTTVSGLPALGAIGQAGDWDDLEFDRYTEFDRLVRELTEIGADIGASVSELGQLRGDLESVSSRQRRLTTTMQDELMDIRMVPIAAIAPRLYRVIRQVAATRGKDVKLVFEGGETTFDSTLLEALSESLLHLLRNAVDHGIETPAARRRSGKPADGTIRIRSYRDGGEAVIDVIDDGAGIDHARVLERARELGYSVSSGMSKRDALRLIFQPGFSTRVQADEVSGRGVGLEIVESVVARFKGRLSVDSVAGSGTMISLRLPVMLSVTQAFMVEAAGQKYAVPIDNIDFVADRREQPLSRIGDAVVLETSDSAIPAIDLGNRLSRAGRDLGDDDGWIMVARVANERWALCVDELEGQQEIVVKPLGRFLRNTPGVIGATILGNGDVALIVDVPRLIGVEAALRGTESMLPADDELIPVDEPAPDRAPVALIVDDSLSVRRVVGRTLERHGWQPVLARDGHEALEMLESTAVDVVITDIEMPRMDGYELMSALGGIDSSHQTPVVVLTSRSSQKHRERAFELGASAYVVKPFQEQQLIDAVERTTGVPVTTRG